MARVWLGNFEARGWAWKWNGPPWWWRRGVLRCLDGRWVVAACRLTGRLVCWVMDLLDYRRRVVRVGAMRQRQAGFTGLVQHGFGQRCRCGRTGFRRRLAGWLRSRRPKVASRWRRVRMRYCRPCGRWFRWRSGCGQVLEMGERDQAVFGVGVEGPGFWVRGEGSWEPWVRLGWFSRPWARRGWKMGITGPVRAGLASPWACLLLKKGLLGRVNAGDPSWGRRFTW